LASACDEAPFCPARSRAIVVLLLKSHRPFAQDR
jgi:hypothetical protein